MNENFGKLLIIGGVWEGVFSQKICKFDPKIVKLFNLIFRQIDWKSDHLKRTQRNLVLSKGGGADPSIPLCYTPELCQRIGDRINTD